MIISHVSSLNYCHIENQDTADLISRVVPEFDIKIADSFDSVLGLAGQALSSMSVIVTIMTRAWWAGLIIIASAVPLMFIAKRAGENSYEAQRKPRKYTAVRRIYPEY
jgi:ATP-binding cassette subfamily B protein